MPKPYNTFSGNVGYIFCKISINKKNRIIICLKFAHKRCKKRAL